MKSMRTESQMNVHFSKYIISMLRSQSKLLSSMTYIQNSYTTQISQVHFLHKKILSSFFHHVVSMVQNYESNRKRYISILN